MSLRVLSLNAWALPAPVGRDVPARMDRINLELSGLDADLVLYQEVWTAEARAQLISGGRAAGYEHVWHLEATRGGSGLLALSRTPFLDAAFTRYTLCGLPQRVTHADYYSGKGFVQLVVEQGGTAVTLFATHLHARYAPDDVIDDYLGHRVGEIIEFASAIRAVRGPIVAVGDFNLSDDSPEYSILLGLTQLVDAAATLDVRRATATLENPYRKRRGATGESRIDYVFTRAGEHELAQPLAVARALDGVFEIDDEPATYSDHAGLIADVVFPARGLGAEQQSPFADPEPAAVDLARELLIDGRHAARRRQIFHRAAATSSLVAAGGGILYARRNVTRRRLLRGALFGGIAAATASAFGLLTLSEHFVDHELAGYDVVEQLLDTLSGQHAGITRFCESGVFQAVAEACASARSISLASER